MTKHYFIGYARFALACYMNEETVDVVNGSHKDWPGQGETTKKHISSDIDIKIQDLTQQTNVCNTMKASNAYLTRARDTIRATDISFCLS